MQLSRREFLTGAAGGVGVFCFGPALLGLERIAGAAEAGEDNGKILVLLQLSGGNDGLSTVIPYPDPSYGRARSRLRLGEKEVLRLDDYRGLHPNLKRFHALFKNGRAALVEGAGYPNPNRSHFESMDIWHAADHRGRNAGHGWVGRLVDTHFADSEEPNLVIHIGQRIPFSLQAAIHRPIAFTAPEAYRWVGARTEVEVLEQAAPVCEEEAGKAPPPPPAAAPSRYPGRDAALERLRRTLHEAQASSEKVREAARKFQPKAEYPANPLAGSLATVSALIAGGLRTRIYSVEAPGFDTHTNQRVRHDRLMAELDGAVGAFMEDIERQGTGGNVLVLAFSEFGRRVRENGSGGTDHGVAGPMFAFGHGVKGGLYGTHPSLSDLDKGDLAHTVDFRRVYATAIARWFGADPKATLGQEWEPLAFLPG